MKTNYSGRAFNESLDHFAAACGDMNAAARSLAGAYRDLHAATVDMNLAFQRLSASAERLKARQSSQTRYVLRGSACADGVI